MQKKHKGILSHTKLLLISILLIAAVFRLWNINWDKGFHLHPDERFLVMVTTSMTIPNSFSQYIDPATSKFNPANINYKFYVYGTFPLAFNKFVAQFFHTDDYYGLLYQGRIVSALFDLLVVFLLFKTLELVKKHRTIPQEVVYLGTLFYALAVLPIQLSHYFTVDMFLNFFMMASFYFALKFYYEMQFRDLLASALFLGLALASKVSAIYLLPLLLIFLLLSITRKTSPLTHYTKQLLKKISIDNKKAILPSSILLSFGAFFLLLYIVLRLADPYYFADSNFFHVAINPVFLDNIKTLASWSDPKAWFPPGVQWIHKTPVLYSLYNLSMWGIGLYFFLFSIFGVFVFVKKYRHPELVISFIWVLLFFLYQSSQFSQTMRYLIFLYPFLAILAGLGFHFIVEKTNAIFKSLLIALLFFWPLCFLSIYIQPMSRVAASYWIEQNIPSTALLLNEHWDDALPLSVLPGIRYNIELLPVFDPDNADKWQKMDDMLTRGDYLILSSGRGWSNIPTVPERYPRMTKFYEDLFAGKLPYKKIKEFSSYPSLSYLGIPFTFPDGSAEEAFTVYDHPKVMIFKKY